ncbi:hypothetical protein JOF56_002084 [Kibdelosporangium banguiense]|uniref:Uncharacterized protein n=1 Tax=Kibdelosporangium banguiense TaxID=1365924 RepID=A0ABS4TCL0_9PSEU|nr:hypothetical protein [Kibdelosporangium banguiense]MBP2321699.1 hypothetical protein [Kibdelosporangium banguiense]
MPPIEVVEGDPLPLTPRLAILGLTLDVGPYTSPEEHERHVLATIGSGNWHPSEYDEFRFDRATGLLSSLRLHIPERNAQTDSWRAAPVLQGTIGLKDLVSFTMNPCVTRHATLTELTCLYSADPLPEITRVRVAPNVDLLVSGDRLHGWTLREPERFLVSGREFPQTGAADPGLAALLKDYFDLVADPAIERIEDQDPDMLKALRDLADRIRSRNGVPERREALLAKVNDIIDFFYD